MEVGDRIDHGSTMDQPEEVEVGCRSGSSLNESYPYVFDRINPEKRFDAPAYAVVTGAYAFVAATDREVRYIVGRGDQKLLGRSRYLSPTSSFIIINHFLYSSSFIIIYHH